MPGKFLRAEAIGFRPSRPSCVSTFTNRADGISAFALPRLSLVTAATRPVRGSRRRSHGYNAQFIRSESSDSRQTPPVSKTPPVFSPTHNDTSPSADDRTALQNLPTGTQISRILRSRNPETLLETL